MMKGRAGLMMIGLAFVFGLVISPGCQSGDSTEPKADTAAPSGVSPIENYKQKVVREAMAGLQYDRGRVEIDTAAPRQIEGPRGFEAASARLDEGEAFLERNGVLQAISALTEAVILAPDEGPMYEELGRALAMKGKVKEAEAAFRTALDHDPDSVSARYRLAEHLHAHGRQPEAIKEWTAVVLLNPKHADAHARLALAHYYAGDYESSWRHVQQAEQLGRPLPPQFRPLLSAQMAEPGC